MQCQWQTLMQCIDPIAITVGSFQITWYALCFLVAWAAAFHGTLYFEKRHKDGAFMSRAMWQSLFWWLLLGAFLSARLGFAVFYEPIFFLKYPERLFIPYDFVAHEWLAIRGMSFHGGVVGVGLTLLWWSRARNIRMWNIADRLVVAAPLLAIFGRLGNFLNQELPGRITTHPWGMYFSGETLLRHPSTLYALLGEGVLLFCWMKHWQKRVVRPGVLTVIYLGSYAVVRFVLEYWREPDPEVSLALGVLTRGQILSLGMIFLALLGWFWVRKLAQGNNFQK